MILLQISGYDTMFPFLIGTVRTVFAIYGCEKIAFPFLIGTVRTKTELLSVMYILNVSIPHRYGKNPDDSMQPCIHYHVSIPHRYGKNYSDGSKSGSSIMGFHSS